MKTRSLALHFFLIHKKIIVVYSNIDLQYGESADTEYSLVRRTDISRIEHVMRDINTSAKTNKIVWIRSTFEMRPNVNVTVPKTFWVNVFLCYHWLGNTATILNHSDGKNAQTYEIYLLTLPFLKIKSTSVKFRPK